MKDHNSTIFTDLFSELVDVWGRIPQSAWPKTSPLKFHRSPCAIHSVVIIWFCSTKWKSATKKNKILTTKWWSITKWMSEKKTVTADSPPQNSSLVDEYEWNFYKMVRRSNPNPSEKENATRTGQLTKWKVLVAISSGWIAGACADHLLQFQLHSSTRLEASCD